MRRLDELIPQYCPRIPSLAGIPRPETPLSQVFF